MKNWKTFKKELLKDPEVRKEYDRLKPEYALIASLIRIRINKGLTQKELAKRIGTKQSAIARFESGRSNPSLKFLEKLSRSMGLKLAYQLS
jgi:ribosome-binding protein aMBF1 (putative translation factor)